jgi:hypothetical protein
MSWFLALSLLGPASNRLETLRRDNVRACLPFLGKLPRPHELFMITS